MAMSEKRIFWFDAVRAAAILLVLSTHCFFAKYPTGCPDSMAGAMVEFPLYMLSQSCNGLFIMLSGALLIRKEIAAGFPVFWRRIGRFLILLVFWSVFSNVCGYMVLERASFLEALCRSVRDNTILFGGQANYGGHLWFLIVIGELYLAGPFLARMADNMPAKDFWYFALITVGIFLLPGTLNIDGQFHSLFNANFSLIWGRFDVFGVFASWFLLGYLLSRVDTEAFLQRYVRHYNFVLGILLVLVTAAGGWGECYIVRQAIRIYAPFHLFSESIFIFLNSIILFVLIKHLARYAEPFRRIVEWLAVTSLGIYLCHFGLLYFVRVILARAGVTTASPIYVVCPLAFLGMLVLSGIFARVLAGLPILRFLVK